MKKILCIDIDGQKGRSSVGSGSKGREVTKTPQIIKIGSFTEDTARKEAKERRNSLKKRAEEFKQMDNSRK